MLCLGIESSCDDSSLAIVNEHYEVIAFETIAHVESLAAYQGIVPETVSREHTKFLPIILEHFVQHHDLSKIDAIAYTAGPGLAGSLLVGASLAHSLSFFFKKPLIPIHHLEGHHQAILLEHPEPAYPSLCLVVSGGHTQLMLTDQPGSYEIVGATRDDAAGEAFDKIAKYIGLGYPGGPALSRLARNGDSTLLNFTIPLAQEPNLDLSFSGLKTQAIREWNKGTHQVENFCASVQEAICSALALKTKRAIKQFRPQSLVLAGGVAANYRLREVLTELCKQLKIDFRYPSPQYCTDNAAMIAAAGMRRCQHLGLSSLPQPNFFIKTPWPIHDLTY